jgi:hypothetical protein
MAGVFSQPQRAASDIEISRISLESQLTYFDADRHGAAVF